MLVLLPEELKDGTLGSIGLGEHRGSGLLKDCILREDGAFVGHIEILDPAVGGLEVDGLGLDVGDVELEFRDVRIHLGAIGCQSLQGKLQRRDR